MRRLARVFLALLIAGPATAANVRPVVLRGQAPTARASSIPRLTPGLTPAIPGIAPAALPALTPSIVPAAAPAPAAPPVSALERLQAEVPFEAPKPADLEGGKDYADKAFDFKLGSVSPEAGKGGGAPPATPPGDDGGGPNYPRREIRLYDKVFPSVAFRPNTPVEPLLVQALDAARSTIRIAAYEFKSRAMLEALYRARTRGVDVQIILDHSNVFPYNEEGQEYDRKRSWEIWRLIKDGFDVTVLRGDGTRGINHNKFIVVDGKLAQFGSYNYTWASEKAHYENVNFTDDKKKVKAFADYWDYMRKLSKPVPEARDYQYPREKPAPPKLKQTVDLNGEKLPALMLQPDKEFEDTMVRAIGAVKKSLEIAIFAFRSTKIAEAVAAAHQRGVKVRVIIDRSQHDSETFGVYTQWVAKQGVEVRILAGPNPEAEYQLAEKMHNKLAIFDGKVVETGSSNYSKNAAWNNYENGHFLDDDADVAAYNFFFEHMWKTAKPFTAIPDTMPALPTDEELTRNAEQDPTPIQWPKKPELKPLPPAKELTFNKEKFPSSALLPEVPILPLMRKAIQSSKKKIRLAIYEFNLEEVLEDLRAAKKRGVAVEIVLDRSHVYTTGKGPDKLTPRKPTQEIVALIKEDFDVLLLKGERHGIMHNKIGIFDDKLSMEGSFNFTRQSEYNHYENVTFTTDKAEVADMVAYFKYMRGLAEEVDHDKLDEILSRGASFEAAPPAEDEAAAEAARDSKFPPPPQSKAPPVQLNEISLARYYFSPQGGVEQALIAAIRAAKTSIDIAMFSFYSKNIADALLEMKNKGLKVRLVVDQSQAGLAKLDDWFAYHGFDIVLLAGPNEPWEEDADPKYEKMHHKFMVVDGKVLMTGSFNYSPNAEDNSFEHVRVVEEPLDLARFIEAFARMFARGRKPKPPTSEPQWGTKASASDLYDGE